MSSATGVIESRTFGAHTVRIRRTQGTAPGYGPFVVEHREPGFGWQQWGEGHHTLTGAQWARFNVWGGPRPEGS